jgi:hypothetical protein
MFRDKTVLRGGYAIFFDMPYTNLGINGLGTGFPFSVNQQANGAANVPNVFMSPGDPLANAGSGSIQPVGVNMDLNTAYVQSFQFGLQHQLQDNLLLELTYVGNKSTNLMRQRNINQPFTDGTTASIASRRPHPLYGNVNILEAAGSGHFDSMQFKVEKRFSTGLQFTSAYTWGHSIDDGEGNVQNNYDFRAERASSDFDIRQRWVANYVYDLPFGTGKSVGVNAGRVAQRPDRKLASDGHPDHSDRQSVDANNLRQLEQRRRRRSAQPRAGCESQPSKGRANTDPLV